MASRSPDPHMPSTTLNDDLAAHQASDRVPRPTTIPRFPSFSKRHSSIDSPREIPLPSPSLLQQQGSISPFVLAYDPMDSASSRLNETVSNAAQSQPTSSMAGTLQSLQVPYHLLPRAVAHGKGKTTPILEDEEGTSERSTSPASSDAEHSSSHCSNSTRMSSGFETGPPSLDVSTGSPSDSSTSIESVTSASSAGLSRNPDTKDLTDSTAFHNNRLSSTFSSYSSNGLGSAYARPARLSSPPPYLARHSNASLRFGGSRPSTTSTHSSSSSCYLQPPEPPTILPLDPPENDDQCQSDSLSHDGTLGNSRQAPHVPFLSRGPPPTDSYIEVETAPREYRLHVKLPGFTRDAIMLASKKRRILHIVADRWEGLGGHFERRIAFGYDADLVQVRAEFDGEMLRVVVPRRPPTFSLGLWYG